MKAVTTVLLTVLAYGLGFKKLFEQCRQADSDFAIGETLLGIVTDWSDAEIKGLKNAIGQETAAKLLRGCKVHWLRSFQRVFQCIPYQQMCNSNVTSS